MRTLSANLVTVLVVGGMLLVGAYVMSMLLLPSSQRDPMALSELIRAANRCDSDGGELEVTTDLQKRPTMVVCRLRDSHVFHYRD